MSPQASRALTGALTTLVLVCGVASSGAQAPLLRLADGSPGDVTTEGIRCHTGERLLFEVVVRGPGSVDCELGAISVPDGLAIRGGREHHLSGSQGLEVIFPLMVLAWRPGRLTVPGVPVRVAGGAWDRTEPVLLLVDAAQPDPRIDVELDLEPADPFERQVVTVTLQIVLPADLAAGLVEGSGLLWLPWRTGSAGLHPWARSEWHPSPAWPVLDARSGEDVALELWPDGDKRTLRLELDFRTGEVGPCGLGEGFLSFEVRSAVRAGAGKVSGGSPTEDESWPAGVACSILIRVPERHFNVRVLPREGRPSDWTGSVGRFECRGRVRPGDVTAGDEVTLVLEIEGEGKACAIELPRLPDFATVGFDLIGIEEAGGRDWRRAVVTLVPLHEGVREIPAVTFASFDPVAGAYRHQQIGPFALSVRPRLPRSERTAAGSLSARADRVVAAASRGLPAGLSVARWILDGGWVALPLTWLIALIVWGVRHRHGERAARPRVVTRRELLRGARRRVRKGRRLALDGQVRLAAREIAGASRGLIEALYPGGVSAQGLPDGRRLLAMGLEKEQIEELLDIHICLEAVAFARSSAKTLGRRVAIDEDFARRCLESMDRLARMADR